MDPLQDPVGHIATNLAAILSSAVGAALQVVSKPPSAMLGCDYKSHISQVFIIVNISHI